MSKIPILVFRLEGPLQSWGEHSKWDYRDTGDFPSKSAITGLLACAFGWTRDDERIAKLCNDIDVIVRADRKGSKVRDLHTVSSNEILAAERKRRTGSNTVLSYRYYLQDASFLVGIKADKAVLESCKNALDNPKWTVFLGRKSCVPSCPIVGEIVFEYDSLMQAMERLPVAERHDDIILVQRNGDDKGTENTTVRKMDIIVDSCKRTFQSRLVETVVLNSKENTNVFD